MRNYNVALRRLAAVRTEYEHAKKQSMILATKVLNLSTTNRDEVKKAHSEVLQASIELKLAEDGVPRRICR